MSGPEPVTEQWVVIQVSMFHGHAHSMMVRAGEGRALVDRFADFKGPGKGGVPRRVDILGVDANHRESRLVTTLGDIVAVVLVELPTTTEEASA